MIITVKLGEPFDSPTGSMAKHCTKDTKDPINIVVLHSTACQHYLATLTTQSRSGR